MALKIVNGKVVNVKPPRLTTGQVRKMEKTPTSKKLLKELLQENII